MEPIIRGAISYEGIAGAKRQGLVSAAICDAAMRDEPGALDAFADAIGLVRVPRVVSPMNYYDPRWAKQEDWS